MRAARIRFASLLLSLCLLAGTAPGYYHFLQYPRRGSSTSVVERFDLNSLPNRTVLFFLSEENAVQFAPGDNMTSLASQIRLAAKAWSDVETSELRLGFGGIAPPGAEHATPSIDISFREMPPGVVAMGGPARQPRRADVNAAFVPIVRSSLIVQSDLTRYPSYGEDLFGILTHEFGHTLGLQHSLTSGAMATGRTRSTTKAKPLSPDDVAGVSLLYPAAQFAERTGSIAGRVTLSGQGVALASVVAIPVNGPAVSALTNPDGTFRISGLPPRQYLLYVHSLPPPVLGQETMAGLDYPLNADESQIQPGPAFDLLFFPGVREPERAQPVLVTAGSSLQNLAFAVQRRTSPQIHSIESYGYPSSSFAVKPPYLFPGIPYPYLVARGPGLIADSAPVRGLTVSVLGGAGLPVSSFSADPSQFVQVPLPANGVDPGPRHLWFSRNGEGYVLPSAFFYAERTPPSIGNFTAMQEANGARSLWIGGTQLSAETRILFDGFPAPVRAFDEASGRLLVTPPAAPAGHHASVVALQPDGQSSLFLQGDRPPVYVYDGGEGQVTAFAAPSGAGVNLSLSALAAGAEALVQIETSGLSLTEGQVQLGFGSSDLAVRRLWVLGPNRLAANIAIHPAARQGAASLTLVSGLQITRQAGAVMVQSPQNRPLSLSSYVFNASTGQPVLYPGSLAVLTASGGSGLSAPGVTLNDRNLAISGVSGNLLVVQIPLNQPPGFAVLRLDASGERGLPMGVFVEPAP